MSDSTESFQFDRFTLEPARGLLLGPDGEIRLRPKSYQVLSYLLSHHGQLVSRKELLDAVWGRTAITDDSLTQCLVEIRRALGDDARQVVRTIPRRGYLFDRPVTAAASQPRGDRPAAAEAVRADPVARETGPPRFMPVAAVATAALLAAALTWLGLGRDDEGAPPPSVASNSIAVLPFVDMSAARDQAHLGDGIAEEILNSLAQSRDLKVIARTSSFSFRNRPADIRIIAEQLGVHYVLEGSIRKSGDHVRIIAQLIDARDGAHVWSRDFDRQLDEIFAVQTEIAGEVAIVLEAFLAGAPAESVGHDLQAYEHFLRGRFFFHRRNDDDIERAREHFETAVELDPDYAAAWAALAGTYIVQSVRVVIPAEEPGFAPAQEAAARAIALDPKSVEGHVRTATLLFMAGDEDGGWRHMRIAEALDPQDLLLLGIKAGHALRNGDRATAIETQQRVVQRDPLSPLHRMNLAFMLLAAGRTDEARTQALAVDELNPGGRLGAELLLATALILEQRFAEAADILGQLPADEERDAPLAIAAHALGRQAEYREMIARLRSRDSPSAARALAEVHAQLADIEGAWQWLEKSRARLPPDVAIAEHWWRTETFNSPFLGPLHNDPRWTALFAARVGANAR